MIYELNGSIQLTKALFSNSLLPLSW